MECHKRFLTIGVAIDFTYVVSFHSIWNCHSQPLKSGCDGVSLKKIFICIRKNRGLNQTKRHIPWCSWQNLRSVKLYYLYCSESTRTHRRHIVRRVYSVDLISFGKMKWECHVMVLLWYWTWIKSEFLVYMCVLYFSASQMSTSKWPPPLMSSKRDNQNVKIIV